MSHDTDSPLIPPPATTSAVGRAGLAGRLARLARSGRFHSHPLLCPSSRHLSPYESIPPSLCCAAAIADIASIGRYRRGAGRPAARPPVHEGTIRVDDDDQVLLHLPPPSPPLHLRAPSPHTLPAIPLARLGTLYPGALKLEARSLSASIDHGVTDTRGSRHPPVPRSLFLLNLNFLLNFLLESSLASAWCRSFPIPSCLASRSHTRDSAC